MIDEEKYLPVCDFCGERIYDRKYYVVGGRIACGECCVTRDTGTYVTEKMETEGIDDGLDDDLPFC